MTTVLVVVGLCLVVAIVGLIASWRRADHPTDMGAVSHQWIAEHRLGSGQDSQH